MLPIHIAWHAFLGDLWATCSWCIQESERTGERIRLSRWQHDEDLHPRLTAILGNLCGGERVEVVIDRGERQIEGKDIWAAPITPARSRWRKPTSTKRRVAYQFDGVSSARDKNPPPAHVVKLQAAFPQIEWIRLGRHISISDCVETLANVDAFIGCDSGMSHLAHSVGTPMGVVEYDLPIITTHRGKPYKHLFRMEHAIDWLRQLLFGDSIIRGHANPDVEFLIPTYARTQWVERAIGSVLGLEYPGNVTAVVVNDCPEQVLSCDHPRVKVINYDRVFATIGHKRRRMIEHATSPWIGWLDDDDFVLPWHLDRLRLAQEQGRPIAAHEEHVWMNGMAADLVGKHKLDLLVERQTALAFPYPLSDFKEDIAWADELARSDWYFSAYPTDLPASMATCWGQGLYHVSGIATDQGYVLYRQDARERMASGKEPTGVVRLTPRPEERMEAARRCIMERRSIRPEG